MSYTSSQVQRLLGVKNSVLRYWLDEMPLIQPRKDHFGRRIFSGRDMRLLIRLKYLLYERRLTVEGARAELEKELSGDWQDLRAELDAVRSTLLDLYFLIAGRQ
ncbi:MAG: MerR family transcriptional regulator [Spirochaetaceae bacterium]|jgi:DNA-binding transcriptional MerR regulator|nr:MerR family transcriptional regulator [Spirochaetaceae bacterium]